MLASTATEVTKRLGVRGKRHDGSHWLMIVAQPCLCRRVVRLSEVGHALAPLLGCLAARARQVDFNGDRRRDGLVDVRRGR